MSEYKLTGEEQETVVRGNKATRSRKQIESRDFVTLNVQTQPCPRCGNLTNCIRIWEGHGFCDHCWQRRLQVCRLCGRDEPRCDPKKLLVCYRCFQVVLRSAPEQIKRAYELAIKKGFLEKARILRELFMTGDNENDGQQINTRRAPRHIAKHFDRRRGYEINRPQQKSACRMPEQQAAAIPQNQ